MSWTLKWLVSINKRHQSHNKDLVFCLRALQNGGAAVLGSWLHTVYNMIQCWEEEKGEGAFSFSPTCSKWEMSLCSCSCPIAIFVPENVGHEHSLMMAQSLSWVEKHSCDNSCPFGKAAEMSEFFQLPSHELQGSFWQLNWFAVENSALKRNCWDF